MKISTCIVLGWLLVALPLPARGASIELVASDQTCHLDLSSANPTGTFTIVAVRAAEATCCPGFTGAEFGVEGLSTDWLAIATPNPNAVVVIGSPIGNGVNIAFATDIMDPSVQLFSVSITYLSAGEPQPAVLRVVAKDPPSNQDWTCPLVTGGGGCPCWAMACATGGSLYINSTGDCLVGVQRGAWSSIKGLFR